MTRIFSPVAEKLPSSYLVITVRLRDVWPVPSEPRYEPLPLSTTIFSSKQKICNEYNIRILLYLVGNRRWNIPVISLEFYQNQVVCLPRILIQPYWIHPRSQVGLGIGSLVTILSYLFLYSDLATRHVCII